MFFSTDTGRFLKQFNARLAPMVNAARGIGLIALVLTVVWFIAVVILSQIDLDIEEDSATDLVQLFFRGLIAIFAGCVVSVVICDAFPRSTSSSANDLNPNVDVIEIRGSALVVGSQGEKVSWRDLSSGSGVWNAEGVTDASVRSHPGEGSPRNLLARALNDLAPSLPPLWPIPLLIWPPENRPSSADEVALAAQALEFNELSFVLHDAKYAGSSAGVVEAVFAMFDRNPGMPALLVSSGHASPASGSPGKVVMPNASLIFFVRPERVDRQIRSNAEGGSTGRAAGAAASLRALFAKAMGLRDEPLASGRSVTADQWQPFAAAYMSEAASDGFPGQSVHVPVRWTKDQLKVLDEAPRLGRLHRCASTLEMTGEPADKAVQQAWKNATKALPPETEPQRALMNDTRHVRLRTVLHDMLNPSVFGQSADDKRVIDVGDRGISLGPGGALATLGLAIEASKQSGDVSAFVEVAASHASIAMVSPEK